MRIFIFFVVLVIFGVQALAQFQVPSLTAPVVDEANVVEDQAEQNLNRILRQLRDSGGSQINVLTVPTLNDVPIEQASIEVTDQWKLGNAKGDNGALLLVAMKERKMRVEVGQGLEGSLPDAIASRIIDGMTPLMKEGHTSDAIVIGVASIVKYTDPEFDFVGQFGQRSYNPEPRQRFGPRDKSSGWIWILLLFFFIFLRPRRRRSGLGGALLGYGLGRSHGGWGGGGGFGGFGGGGGGWSGGGGGFSGGGASGGW